MLFAELSKPEAVKVSGMLDETVEVGEEVFFSATGTTYPDTAILSKARYEWDFGDGYYLRFDPAVKTTTRSGIAATHYFMKPGDFTVKLTVTVWAQVAELPASSVTVQVTVVVPKG